MENLKINESVDLWMEENKKCFFPSDIPYLDEKLREMTLEEFVAFKNVELRNPLGMLLLAIFFGGLGVDCFMLGDKQRGVIKLLTVGLFGIFTWIDIFNAQNRTKKYNFTKVLERIK